jgi:hypothetical protein
MLVAYLPAEKILINADLYSPPVADVQQPPGLARSAAVLNENVKRLKLDVRQHVPIHGRSGTHEEFLKIAEAAVVSQSQ